jgi:Uma2 family endonuclease
MGEAAQRLKMTFEEYLAFERDSDQKHELVGGEIYAMSGGSREHSLLATNFARELGNALEARPCEVHGPDMKIKAADGDCHYPDVSVVCGPPAFADGKRDAILNPKAIVEVLSDSTEHRDRHDKFASYRTIETLVDYVMVAQWAVRVEHFHRRPDGAWLFRALGPGETLVLPSVGCEIAVDRVYSKVFAKE